MAGVVAGVLIAGMGAGYPATRANLMSGAAWLPSTQVGQLTLLDGSSGRGVGPRSGSRRPAPRST